MARNKDISLPLSLAVKVELFKRGCFDFITCKDGKRHEKQGMALSILTDNDHVEVLYGGAPAVQNRGQVPRGCSL